MALPNSSPRAGRSPPHRAGLVSGGPKALDAADRLALGHDAASLRRLVRDEREFVRLVDALVQVRHDEEGYREMQELAGSDA